ncbi:hypothetical protein DFJ63DRAFT_299564 [Scheffersomyces coipomensis]|uniref:uncharacterized protein n=1 Tax=Scheffersomyces coipomensis TaxID=1788519 RepID=UPI00315CFAF4
MGAKLSLMAPSAQTVAISSYVDVLENFRFVEMLNNSRFLKTIKAIDSKTGNYVVIKILIKPSNGYNLKLDDIVALEARQASMLSQYNNILPWQKIIETDRAGYLVRQLLKTNLYDRLSLRPFLAPIEKSFMVFQMLKIASDIHSLNIYHGDIKLENFLVTSWNWLMLTDFADYSKPTYILEDNPNQFSFYYDTSGRRVCYLAPERFYSSQKSNFIVQNVDDDGHFNGDKLTEEMDLFSLGCVIAELYSDGEPTFTLSQLFKFMKNEYVPDLSAIQDTYIRELVTQLLDIDPSKRPSASSILRDYKDKCFPSHFYDFLYNFLGELNTSDSSLNTRNMSSSDFKIDHIYSSYARISQALNFKYTPLDGQKSRNSIIKLNLPGMPPNYSIKPNPSSEPKQPALIILSIVFSLTKSLKRVSSKLKAAELILALSERIKDEEKLDRSLPYLMSLFDVYRPSSGAPIDSSSTSAIVICKALTAITALLESCKYITPINVLMFQEYLLPRLNALPYKEEILDDADLVRICIARCLPYLALTAKRFLMMSKTFKSETLNNINSKLGSLSLNTNYGDDYNTFNISKDQLDIPFKDLTLKILIDSNSYVKISLINNILPLCDYFGVDKTNDIILPHLISYLNDSNYSIRLSFLSSVLEIAPFVAVLSFEQYILPLLIQTLRDPEPFVVLKVLEIFNQFVVNKLINPEKEFNVSEIYKELLSNSTNLLLLPNEWIRQSVLTLIVSIGDKLSDADKYCFLYPVIKGFLSYDPSEISWEALYVCLTKPLSKPVFDLSVTWSLNATKKALFWNQKNFSLVSNTTNSSKKLVAFSKNMAKSVYLPITNNNEPNRTLTNGGAEKPTFPLSAEDKQWVIKLKSIGLDDKDLIKIFILRDYISHISTPKLNEGKEPDDIKFYRIRDLINLKPRNIFFQITYKSEPLITASRITRSDVDASTNPGDSVSLREFESRSLNSFILPNLNRIKASVQTVQENVFGEMELSYDGIAHDSIHSSSHKVVKDHNGSTHKVFTSNSSKIVTANSSHDYQGDNPFILNYLTDLALDPTLSDFPEFGSYVKSHKSAMLASSKKKELPVKAAGILISQIDQGSTGGFTCVLASPTGEFIITGSELGGLKIWDCVKMKEAMALMKTPSLSLQLGSSITCIQFIPNRFVFAVSTADGIIRIYRIDVLRNNKKITKYSDLSLIRKFELDANTYATELQFCISEKSSVLVAVTTASKILTIDIIKMKKTLEVQNPQIHGNITTFIVGDKMSWVIVGTDRGILSLWDIRFKILVKSYKVKLDQSPTTGIKKLMIFPGDYKLPLGESLKDSFVMIGGSEAPDISIWSIPDFQCKQILRSSIQGRNFGDRYSLTEVSNSIKDSNLDNVIDSISLNLDKMYLEDESGKATDCSMSSFKYYPSEHSFISTTWDSRIIVWNIQDITESSAIGKGIETIFVHTAKMVCEVYRTEQAKPDYGKRKESYDLKSVVALQSGSATDHQDKISDVEMVNTPTKMIISVDRIGRVNVYK